MVNCIEVLTGDAACTNVDTAALKTASNRFFIVTGRELECAYCTSTSMHGSSALGAFDDGVVGPQTLGALSAVPGAGIAARLTGHRLHYMTSLKTWPAFGRGWANRIAKNLMGV